MDFSLKEALGSLVWITVCTMILASFGTVLSHTGAKTTSNTISDDSFFKSNINEEIFGYSVPTLDVQDIHLNKNQAAFDINSLIAQATAYDTVDGDISSNIKVYGNVDINTSGIYQIKFVVENSKGLKTAYIKNVLVD